MAADGRDVHRQKRRLPKKVARAIPQAQRPIAKFPYLSKTHAPRMRETSGRERMWRTISSRGLLLISSTLSALATSNRPDLIRRSDFQLAPQPGPPPISCP